MSLHRAPLAHVGKESLLKTKIFVDKKAHEKIIGLLMMKMNF